MSFASPAVTDENQTLRFIEAHQTVPVAATKSKETTRWTHRLPETRYSVTAIPGSIVSHNENGFVLDIRSSDCKSFIWNTEVSRFEIISRPFANAFFFTLTVRTDRLSRYCSPRRTRESDETACVVLYIRERSVGRDYIGERGAA